MHGQGKTKEYLYWTLFPHRAIMVCLVEGPWTVRIEERRAAITPFFDWTGHASIQINFSTAARVR